ncbi:unnamed protein product [Symbiodinium necroappetens]|uniref:Uncharacterized protein n=1 Tax=Symbiodinium necroappetens TaxID=1628268 RepID=A0A812U6Q9_9DINO|nr:unnamed protein product [Symbiodinium necroappetens]
MCVVTSFLRLPKIIDSPDLHLARWEFTVRAPATEVFLSNQFDLFPSPIGKLLNARLAQCFHSLMVVSKRGRKLCSPQAATEAMSAEEKDEKDGDSSVSPTDLMRDAIQKGREEIEKHGEVVREAIQKGREEIEKHGEEAW